MSRRKNKSWTKCKCGMNVPPKKKCPLCSSNGTAKKAAVAIDDYKLRTFARILDRYGFDYVQGPGLTEGALMLYVVTEDLVRLREAVTLANRKCAELSN